MEPAGRLYAGKMMYAGGTWSVSQTSLVDKKNWCPSAAMRPERILRTTGRPCRPPVSRAVCKRSSAYKCT